MKIAVVGPAYPFRGGIAHYTMLLAAHLKPEHEVRLYSFKQQYPAWLFPGRSQIDPSGEPLADVETRRWLTPWWPLSWRRVTDDWQAWQPDRVEVQWWVPFMAPMTAWLIDRARRAHISASVICHNVLPHERSRVDRFLARLALRRANGLIVHSTAQQALARELLPGCTTSVVSLPTYAAFQTGGWTRDRARAHLGLSGHVLLFFGLVRPIPGTEPGRVGAVACVGREHVYMPVQRHTDKVLFLETMEPKVADAVITKKSGIIIGVQSADCVPLLLFDRRRHAIAAVHAGWRGTAQGILKQTLNVMTSSLFSSPSDIRIAIGPSIRWCCYEVSPDVHHAVQKESGQGEYSRTRADKYLVDLASANRHQALSCGVPEQNIVVARLHLLQPG